MNDRPESEPSLLVSYLTLRKIIGILGLSFPFVLLVGAAIVFQTGIQSSLSSYYHTGMGDVFVGTLWAIGFFLLSYRGYKDSPDNVAGNLACVFAVGVTLFRTTPDSLGDTDLVGYIHLAFAASFFLTLIYFCLFLFTKTHKHRQPTSEKLQRNKVYRGCGYTMIGCILLIAVYYFLPDDTASALEAYHPVFWLEAIAVLAFGVSWAVKGEALALLND